MPTFFVILQRVLERGTTFYCSNFLCRTYTSKKETKERIYSQGVCAFQAQTPHL